MFIYLKNNNRIMILKKYWLKYKKYLPIYIFIIGGVALLYEHVSYNKYYTVNPRPEYYNYLLQNSN